MQFLSGTSSVFSLSEMSLVLEQHFRATDPLTSDCENGPARDSQIDTVTPLKTALGSEGTDDELLLKVVVADELLRSIACNKTLGEVQHSHRWELLSRWKRWRWS